jgi:hypothetical protein
MKYFIRSLILGITLISCNALAQDVPVQNQKSIYTDTRKILFLLRDGEDSYKLDRSAFLKEVNTAWIDKMNVLKQANELEKFGEEGRDGVVIITFKEGIEAAAIYLRNVKKTHTKIK